MLIRSGDGSDEAAGRASHRARENVRQSPCTSTIIGGVRAGQSAPDQNRRPDERIRRDDDVGLELVDLVPDPEREPHVEQRAVQCPRAFGPTEPKTFAAGLRTGF